MSKRRSVLALAVAVLVLAVGAVVVWSRLPPHQSDDVAVPAAAASPQEVVTAYLAALDVHDCATAEALSADPSATAGWCEDVAHLDDVVVREPVEERTGRTSTGSGQDVVRVPVSFELSYRLFHGDAGLEEGETTWGYRLARASEGEPWRIVDQGVA